MKHKKKNKIFKKVLITGCAGFIGFSLAKKFLSLNNFRVYGIDNINSYYDTKLKKKRLELLKNKKFKFYKFDIKYKSKILINFKKNSYDYIFHLAAQAGVRYSIDNPQAYIDSNITGFFNILEASRMFKPKLIFFASSSSVYGDQKKMPLTENTATDKPKSFYAATKKCNEIMSYSYSELYKLNIIGLRFFTVYGPYGRPDMTPYSFLIKHFKNKFINIFNYGNHKRDFTYIDDAINSIISLFKVFEKKKKLVSYFEIFNIARGNSKKLMDYIKLIELNIGKKIKKKFIKKQKGDVDETFASTKKVNKIINYKPKYNIENGIKKFVDWFKLFHNLKK